MVAAAVPVTSECTATEGDLGPPSVDPAFRWEAPVITGTTVTRAGPNTITVANTLTRDNGSVLVSKVVTGATEGYIGGPARTSPCTASAACPAAADPDPHPRRLDRQRRRGRHRAGQHRVDLLRGRGHARARTCCSTRRTRGGQPILDPAGDVRADPARPRAGRSSAENPIVRVTSSFSIVKEVDDPFGAVDPAATFTGTYSCQYGTDAPVDGHWSISAGATTARSSSPSRCSSGPSCTVTEDAPGTTGAAPTARSPGRPRRSAAPATVEAGGTSSVTVTNTVDPAVGGLQVTKTVVDPDGGVRPGRHVPRRVGVHPGRDTYSGRFTVAAPARPRPLFTPADAARPGDRDVHDHRGHPLDADGLRDASFAWGAADLRPAERDARRRRDGDPRRHQHGRRVYSDVDDRQVGHRSGRRAGARRPGVHRHDHLPVRDDEPVATTWPATTDDARAAGRRARRVGVHRRRRTHRASPASRSPATRRTSGCRRSSTGPVTVAPPDEPTPVLVTNPTDRRFGTFDVDQAGRRAPSRASSTRARRTVMEFACTSEVGRGDHRRARGDGRRRAHRRAGAADPDRQHVHARPSRSTRMPPLVDAAWIVGRRRRSPSTG